MKCDHQVQMDQLEKKIYFKHLNLQMLDPRTDYISFSAIYFKKKRYMYWAQNRIAVQSGLVHTYEPAFSLCHTRIFPSAQAPTTIDALLALLTPQETNTQFIPEGLPVNTYKTQLHIVRNVRSLGHNLSLLSKGYYGKR